MSSPQRPSKLLVRNDSHVNSENSSTIDVNAGYPFPSFPGDVEVDADVPEMQDILEEMPNDPDVKAAVDAHDEALEKLEEAVLSLEHGIATRVTSSGSLGEAKMPLSPEIAVPISILSQKSIIKSPTLRPTLKSPTLAPEITPNHPSPIFVFLKKKEIPTSEETVIDLSVTQGLDLQNVVWKLLESLAPQYVEGVTEAEQVQLTRLSGAFTNCVFVVKTPPLAKLLPDHSGETKSRRVLLRIYGVGVDRFVHRERELVWMCRLSSMKVGPRLIGCFGNGRLEEFVDSLTLTRLQMRDPQYSTMIAKELIRFHLLGSSKAAQQVSDEDSHDHGTMTTEPEEEVEVEPTKPSDILSGQKDTAVPPPKIKRNSTMQMAGVLDANGSEIWDRLAKWYLLAQDAEETLMARDEQTKKAMEALDLPKYAEEMVLLRQRLEENIFSPLVFSHNDLQYGNVLIRKVDGSIMIVDYEYAGYNYRGMDLGNHFCEWAADYHCSTPHNLDYSKYPNKEQQLLFFNAYVDAESDITKRVLTQEAKDEIIQSLLKETDAYGLLSHIHWGLWGVIQAVDNVYSGADGDFDYLEYGLQRFREYEKQKWRVFGK